MKPNRKLPVTLPLSISPTLMFWKKKTVTINEYDPTYKATYLGNILTSWAKGEGCEEKPLQTLWNTYKANPTKLDMPIELTVCNSGMKAVTRKSVVEYWAYRVTYCCAPKEYPGVFCWVYRHEGPKLQQQLRCHAALCSKPEQAKELASQLTDRLAFALQEFRREKLTQQKARLSLANACYDCPMMPQRKLLLSRGSINFRRPLELSKIAPKLTDIEESLDEEAEQEKFFSFLREVQNASDPCIYFNYSSSLDSDISSAASSLEENSPPRLNSVGSLNSIGTSISSGSSSGDDDDEPSEDTIDLSEHALLLA